MADVADEDKARLIAARLAAVRQRMDAAAARAGRDPRAITLVAVSKTQPADSVRAAAAAGQMVFGENRLEEALPKMQGLAQVAGLEWHMIGHLQSRKARQAAGAGFGLIHSVDTLKLAERLGQAAHENGRRQPVLLELNVSGEASKAGFRAGPGEDWTALTRLAQVPGLEVRGLMTMAPMSPDPSLARPYFERLRQVLDELGQQMSFGPAPVLSMGMSDDFEVAIEAGATMVRVGRAIFGERD